jgi:hypothetical protein
MGLGKKLMMAFIKSGCLCIDTRVFIQEEQIA